MQLSIPHRVSLVALGAALAGLGWPSAGYAQTVNGQARAVSASVSDLFGTTTTVLSDTGTLSDAADARESSQPTGDVPSLLSVATLHAATIAGGSQVMSEASIADLALTVAGTTIGADFVMARARAAQGETGAGGVDIDSLSINGLAIAVTGEPNQTVAIPGGQVVINEQQASAAGTVVNALHITVSGVADVVIASASAGVQ